MNLKAKQARIPQAPLEYLQAPGLLSGSRSLFCNDHAPNTVLYTNIRYFFAFLLQSFFCQETLKYGVFVTEMLKYASGAEYVGIFTFGADAPFCGSLVVC